VLDGLAAGGASNETAEKAVAARVLALTGRFPIYTR
jgi:hypothetical protein